MRAWPLHVVFAIILVGSLATNVRTTEVLVEKGDLEPAVRRVARLHGLAFQEYVTVADTDVRALVFEAPGCSRPVLVVSLLVTFDQESVVRSAREPDYALRYVYINHTWNRPDRLAVFVERIKYAALATFGLTQYVPTWHLLLIEAPSHCEIADAIDWRIVWNRDYLRATGAATR